MLVELFVDKLLQAKPHYVLLLILNLLLQSRQPKVNGDAVRGQGNYLVPVAFWNKNRFPGLNFERQARSGLQLLLFVKP